MKNWSKEEFRYCLLALRKLWSSKTEREIAAAKARLSATREQWSMLLQEATLDSLIRQVSGLLEKEHDEIIRNHYESVLDDLITIQEIKYGTKQSETSKCSDANSTGD